MKRRYLFTFAFAALAAYLLGAGCTQDFGAFKHCKEGDKVCGTTCVAISDPKFGCSSTDTECEPCAVANAVAVCAGNTCDIGACSPGFQSCNNDSADGCEIDTAADPANCGACGNTCVTPNGQPACAAGQCTVGSCDPGFDDCNGDPADGCEANTGSDPGHCGACGTTCPQFQQCQNGQCALICDTGKGDCDGNPDNGCETTFGSDANCAFCGNKCDLPNASSKCDAGVCVIDKCNNNFEDCDGMDASGCEVNTNTNAANCGACGRACDTTNVMSATCSNGTCDSACTAGFGNCSKPAAPAPDDGCETNTGSDAANCGACNQPCAPANGVGQCAGGTCSIAMCNAPFADCDGMAATGCETNTNTSAANCGMCGNGCNFPNAAASCASGMCQLGACNNGFGNCDGMAANGCETNTNTNVANCGACGRACDSTNTSSLTCAAGLCTPMCNNGFGDCTKPAAPTADNGCETNLSTDVDHCGSCTRPCSGAGVSVKSCTMGLCDSYCNAGFANCMTPAAPTNDNGCELNVNTSNNNCGGCGNNCSLQGGALNKFACDGGAATQQYCGCSANNECQGLGVPSGAGGGQCVNATGLCQCNGVTCNPSEACILSGINVVCSCNGGAACGAGQTCCQTPGGCKSLLTDAQNCGACGHECAPGLSCVNGVCQ